MPGTFHVIILSLVRLTFKLWIKIQKQIFLCPKIKFLFQLEVLFWIYIPGAHMVYHGLQASIEILLTLMDCSQPPSFFLSFFCYLLEESWQDVLHIEGLGTCQLQ